MLGSSLFRKFAKLLGLILALNFLTACPGKLQGNVEFSKEPPSEVELASKVLQIPVGSDFQIPITSGTPPFTYEVLEGFVVVDSSGKILAPSFLNVGTIKITDSENKTTVVPYVVVSSPKLTTSVLTINPSAKAPMNVIGGVPPYSYNLLSGSGALDADGIYAPNGYQGLASIEVVDSIGSRDSLQISVQGGLATVNPVEILNSGASLDLSVVGAVGTLTYQVVAGEGIVNSATGRFVAPSTNGTTIIRIVDGLGNITYKEISVTNGSNGPLTLYPASAAIGAGQSLKLSSSGGIGSKIFSKVNNASDSLIGPGNLVLQNESATLTAPDSLTEPKEVTISVQDSQSNVSQAIVTLYPKPNASPSQLNLVVAKSAQINITGGKSPFAVTADRGSVRVSGSTLSYTAPTSEGTATIKVKDVLGQETFISIVINGGLTIAPSKISLNKSMQQSFSGLGGKAPYSYRLLDKQGQVVSQETYGSISAEGIYQAPQDSVELQVEVQDAEGTKAQANVVIEGQLQAPPAGVALSLLAKGVVDNKLAIGNVGSIEITGGEPPYEMSVNSQSVAQFSQVNSTVGEYIAKAAGSFVITVKDRAQTELTQTVTVVDKIVVNPMFAAIDAGTSQSFTLQNGVPPYQSIQLVGGSGSLVCADNSTGTTCSGSGFTFQAGTQSDVSLVRVMDALGNLAEATIQTKAVQIIATLSGVPSAINNSTSLAINVAGDGVAQYKFALTDNLTTCALANYSSATDVITPISLQAPYGADGNYRLCVKGLNVNGLEQATATQADWVKDTLAPTAVLSGAPTGVSNVTYMNVGVSGAGVSHYKFKLIDGTSCSDLSGEAEVDVTSSINGSTGADGDKILCVIARDLAGNYQAVATSAAWTKETSGPTVTLSGLPTNPSNVAQLNVQVSGTDVVDYVYKIVEATSCGDASGYSQTFSKIINITDLLGGKADGSLTLCVRGLNSLSVLGSPVSHTWIKDTQNPIVAITSPAPSAYVNSANQSSIAISGTCSESGRSVSITATGGLSSNVTCSGSNTWSTNFDFTGVSEGGLIVSANHADLAGNNATAASINLTKDTVAPNIGFAHPAENSWINGINKSSLVVDGTASADGSLTLKVGSTTLGTTTVSSGTWSTSLDFTGVSTEGAISITALLNDAAGNSGTANLNLNKDTLAPTAPSSIVDGIYSISNSASPLVTFTAGTDSGGSGVQSHQARVVLSSNPTTTLSSWASISSGDSIGSLSLTSGVSYKIAFKVVDVAGNESGETLSDGWLVDSTAPSGPSSLALGTVPNSLVETPTITWTAGDDAESGVQNHEVQLWTGTTSVGDWTILTSGNKLTGVTLANGTSYFFKIRTRDNAGNLSNEISSDPWTANKSGTTWISTDGGDSTNGGYTCSIRDGKVKCWGLGTTGQLGNSASVSTINAVQVTGLTSGATMVAAGILHACAIHNGAAKCWGSNTGGALGDNSTTTRNYPVQVVGLTSDVTWVATNKYGSINSDYYSCAVHAGAAKCWGTNKYGYLGNSTSSTGNTATPAQVTGLTSGVTMIAAGGAHTCAIQAGALKCWGLNNKGQLGIGSSTGTYSDFRTDPVQVTGLTSGVTWVSAGYQSTCAVHDGVVKCWGQNTSSSLGTGVSGDQVNPIVVAGLATGATKVSHNGVTGHAIINGSLYGWGHNTYGTIGNGGTTTSGTPSLISLSSTPLHVESGMNGNYKGQTCSVLEDGSARCWGFNGYSQVGDTTTTQRNAPVEVINGADSANPTNLSLSHSNGLRQFSVSWTAGLYNGGAAGCKLQYFKDEATWTDVSATTYNCDANATAIAVALPSTANWTNNFNSTGVSLRLLKISDSTSLGTFPQRVTCTAPASGGSSIFDLDEDCNGTWGDSSTRRLFYSTGGTQTFTVPAGVTSITVKLWGGGGGGGATSNSSGNGTMPGNVGGAGQSVTGTLTVTPSESLTIVVGGGGTGGSGASGGAGGYSNGAAGATGLSDCHGGGGGGGGSSLIKRSSTDLIIAGGGGGGGGGDCWAGTTGYFAGKGGPGGLAGTSNNGGTAAGAAGASGTALGVVGATNNYGAGGGGGGGGYRGGGGGSSNGNGGGGGSISTVNGTGGGGGSAYTSGVGSPVVTNGTTTNTNAPLNTDSVYLPGAAVGGAGNASGGAGYIVISW